MNFYPEHGLHPKRVTIPLRTDTIMVERNMLFHYVNKYTGIEIDDCQFVSEKLAEMQFTIDEDEYCARIQPAALKKGELMNISGIYYKWEHEEPITVGHCDGTIAMSQADSEDWVELCLWYDLAPGLMYSLSVVTTELDGLDLTAVAQQVYVPMQGDS